MTNMNSNGVLLFRPALIKSLVTKLIDNLSDGDIINVGKLISDINVIFQKGVVESQELRKIEIFFKSEDDEILSALSVEIDWARHEFHMRGGDEYVLLTRHLVKGVDGGLDFTLKSVSESLEELRSIMYGASLYLKWRRYNYVIWWNNDAVSSGRQLIRAELGLVDVTPAQSQKHKEFFVKIGVVPDKADEVGVYFSSVAA